MGETNREAGGRTSGKEKDGAEKGRQQLVEALVEQAKKIAEKGKGKKAAKKAVVAAQAGIEWFDRFFGELYGARWEKLLRGLLRPQQKAALFNRYAEKGEAGDEMEKLSEEVPWASSATRRLRDLSSLTEQDREKRWLEFPKPSPTENGLLDYYCIDLASLLPVLALDIQDFEQVLDMCAAPGGKTLAILQKSRRLNLTINDPSQERRTRLRKVMDNYLPEDLAASITVWGRDGRDLGQNLESFDKVLCDVPCSGERHLLHSVKELLKWSPKMTVKNAALQVQLLRSAISCCKVGGVIVYSTCSISVAENDEVIEKVLLKSEKKGQQVDVVPLELPIGEKTKHGWLALPRESAAMSTNVGPIYICKLQRRQ